MLFLILYLLLTGIMLVTNIEVVAMHAIRGISALVAAVLLLIGK
jgi:hypothetical protein